MTEQGEVKIKVRRVASSLDEFTAKQLAKITGLNESSIRTELNRMLEAGYIAVHRAQDSAKGRRGRPVSVYQVVSDPAKRTALMQSVMAFHPYAGAPLVAKPTSPHYVEAAAILDQQLDRVQKGIAVDSQLMDLALEHLAIAADDEAVGESGAELIGAWITLEEAKARALLGDTQSAIALRDAARQRFRQGGVGDQDTPLREVDECVFAAEMSALLADAEAAHMRHDETGASQVVHSITTIAEALGHPSASCRLIVRMGRLLEGSLLSTAEWKSTLVAKITSDIDLAVERDADQAARLHASSYWQGMEDTVLSEQIAHIPTSD